MTTATTNRRSVRAGSVIRTILGAALGVLVLHSAVGWFLATGPHDMARYSASAPGHIGEGDTTLSKWGVSDTLYVMFDDAAGRSHFVGVLAEGTLTGGFEPITVQYVPADPNQAVISGLELASRTKPGTWAVIAFTGLVLLVTRTIVQRRREITTRRDRLIVVGWAAVSLASLVVVYWPTHYALPA